MDFSAPVTKQQTMTVEYDAQTGVLTVRKAKSSKVIMRLNREKIDSGALTGLVDKGHVVIGIAPQAGRSGTQPDSPIVKALVRKGVLTLVVKPWGTWGGYVYRAALVTMP